MRKIIAVLLCTACIFIHPLNAFAAENFAKGFVDLEVNHVNPLYADVVTEETFSAMDSIQYVPMSDGDVEYMTSIDEAGEYLRNKFVERETEVTLNFSGEDIDPQTIATVIFEEAIKHGVSPFTGDYLLGQYGGWQAKISGYTYAGTYYLTIYYYNIVYYSTAEQEAEVDEKVNEVLESLDLEGKTDYETVKAIYDYICKNVTYDYKNLNDESYLTKFTAYAALIDKTAVCQGYSMLFYRMAMEEDIDARFVTGVQTSTQGPHGWNIVELNGKYYNLDSTWDSGRTYYSYFLKNNEDFLDHTRNREYNNSEFNSAYPMSETSFNPAVDDFYVASGYCGADIDGGKNLSWTLDKKGVLSISGEGDMAEYYVNPLSGGIWGTSAPWGEYWEQITSIVIGEGVTSIGEAAFYRFWNVTGELELPSTLRKIGADAFNAVPYEGTLVIPEGVESIGAWAFTRTFFDFAEFPSTLKEIAVNAFYVNQLQQITVSSGNEYFCSVDGVLFSADKTRILLYPNALPEKYTVPEGVTEIGQYAFSASSAAGIVLPETLTYIDGRAFNDYSGTITVNSKLETIEDFAFFPMDNEILHIYFMAGEPGSIKSDSFRQTNGTIKLYYLSGTEDKWTFDADGLWNGFVLNEYVPEGNEYDDFVIASGICGDNLTWELTYGGTITISGTGKMYDYDDDYGDPTPWFEMKDRIKAVVFEEGITYIGEYAFKNCENLTGSLHFPESLTAIGWYAFQNCSGITGQLIFPEGLTSIGDWAFSKCSSLTGTLKLPKGITRLGNQVFYNCSGITGSLAIPEGVKSLGNWAFYGCGINEFYFEGDAPSVYGASEKFPSFNASEDTLYFLQDKSGWELDDDGLWNGYKTTVYEKAKVVYGDVDGNGRINVLDANLIRRYSAKIISFTEEQFVAADVDGNTRVNVLDASYIRRYAAKIITVFPVEE